MPLGADYLLVPKHSSKLSLIEKKSGFLKKRLQLAVTLYGHMAISEDGGTLVASSLIKDPDTAELVPAALILNSGTLEVEATINLSRPPINAIKIHDVISLARNEFLIGTSPQLCVLSPPGELTPVLDGQVLPRNMIYSHILRTENELYLTEMDENTTRPTGAISRLNFLNQASGNPNLSLERRSGVRPDSPDALGFFHPFFDQDSKRFILTTLDRKETTLFTNELTPIASVLHDGYIFAGLAPEGEDYLLLGPGGVATVNRQSFLAQFSPSKYSHLNQQIQSLVAQYDYVQFNHPTEVTCL